MKKSLKIVFFIAVGYFIAVLSFERDLEIDFPTQQYSIRYHLFPFSRTERLPPNYFPRYFRCVGLRKNPLLHTYVDTKTMFPFADTKVSSDGQAHISAMNILVRLDEQYEFAKEQRDCIASNYYHLCSTTGATSAKHYALILSLRLMETPVSAVDLAIPDEVVTRTP
jgi:hypothetical protein